MKSARRSESACGSNTYHYAKPYNSPSRGHAGSGFVTSGSGTFMGRTEFIGFRDRPYTLEAESFKRAERRHVRKEEVVIQWRLKWENGRLRVDIMGNPQQRPCQLYVVVEERCYSGAGIDTDGIPGDSATIQIPTPFKMELVNQAILIPEDFFKREAEALAWGEKLYDQINNKYAEGCAIGSRNRRAPRPWRTA